MILFIVFIAALTAVLLTFAGLGIKILLRRHGEFKRPCSSRDPYSGQGASCTCAAQKLCDKKANQPHQPLEVNEELLHELNR